MPAIKPAAALSRSKMVSVLATPGTVQREYTRALIDSFAADCGVTLVGSTTLAALTEKAMAGRTGRGRGARRGDRPMLRRPKNTAEDDERRTDTIVLACTHYPLLVDRFNGAGARGR